MTVSTAIKPNVADIRLHLDWLTQRAEFEYADALIEIACGPRDRGPCFAQLFGIDELDKAVSFAEAQNNAGMNVYVGSAFRSPEADRSRRSSATDYYVAHAAPVDIDANVPETLSKLATIGEVGLTVRTGTTPQERVQVWLPLPEPCDCAQTFADGLTAVAIACGSDIAATGTARLMRLGGTVSYPSPAKIERGYVAELTVVTIHADAKPFDIDAFVAGAVGWRGTVSRPESTHVSGDRAVQRDQDGRIVDGREGYWRDTVFTTIADYQAQQGTDPTADDLFHAAYAAFTDESAVNHGDGRWTSPAGQRQLRQRVNNTIRRLKSGTLGNWGLESIETGAGHDAAVTYRANREATAHGSDGKELLGPRADASASDVEVGTLKFIDPWEKPAPPPFPLDALPTALQAFCRMQGISTGGDINAVAMAALTACGGALDQQIRLKMKRTGDWKVPPRLWTLLVGDPSVKKTPILNAALKPLRDHEACEWEDYADAKRQWEASRDAKEEAGPPPPLPVRYTLMNTTPEALIKVLSGQDRGVLMVADEFSGFIGAMDKYSGGKGAAADRSVWLQAYNGGFATTDRVGSGTTHVKNFGVGFIAGVQPERLAELSNLTSDGLLQRFVPVMMQASSFPREVEDDGPSELYDRLIGRLMRVEPTVVMASAEALDVFEEFQREIYRMEQLQGLGGAFTSFLGKLTGLQGSLALILHLISAPDNFALRRISGEDARAATRILKEFVIPHAHLFYRVTSDRGDWDQIRSIASFVLTQDRERLTQSDLVSGVRALRGRNQRDVAASMSPLVAGGWLVEDGLTQPPKAWRVQPGLRTFFAERRRTEIARKAEAQAMILQSADKLTQET